MDKIEGVFLYEKEANIGTGHTRKIVKQQMFCIAREIDDNEVEIRYLGADDKPLELAETIPKDDFVRNFTFQPYYFESKHSGEQKKLNKHIAIAEEHARKKEFYSAEYEFKNALKIDEKNLRANFGIGNVYLAMGQREKASEIFVKISHIDAIFEEDNKHFFNECAIQLRKQELFDESIDYYTKAITLSPNDENLYFNLCRAHVEKGAWDIAREQIYKALSLYPDFKEGKAMLHYIDQKQAASSADTPPPA